MFSALQKPENSVPLCDGKREHGKTGSLRRGAAAASFRRRGRRQYDRGFRRDESRRRGLPPAAGIVRRFDDDARNGHPRMVGRQRRSDAARRIRRLEALRGTARNTPASPDVGPLRDGRERRDRSGNAPLARQSGQPHRPGGVRAPQSDYRGGPQQGGGRPRRSRRAHPPHRGAAEHRPSPGIPNALRQNGRLLGLQLTGPGLQYPDGDAALLARQTGAGGTIDEDLGL